MTAPLRLIVPALAALLVAPSVARAGSASPAAAALDPAAAAALVEKGKALYAHHCSHCHGFNLVNPGTVSYDLRTFPRDDQARFEESVVNGKNGRMPAWGDLISLEEIDAIWAYVLTGGKS
jgi:mono/diheme cytochrome c family protein